MTYTTKTQNIVAEQLTKAAERGLCSEKLVDRAARAIATPALDRTAEQRQTISEATEVLIDLVCGRL